MGDKSPKQKQRKAKQNEKTKAAKKARRAPPAGAGELGAKK